MGHAGPGVAERSCPHFGHFAMDAMRRDYNTRISEEQLTKVTEESDCTMQISECRFQIADFRTHGSGVSHRSSDVGNWSSSI